MYTLYKHTTKSGKVYIGITSRKPEYRWRNGKAYKNNKYFYNAILKYGWNNIKPEILLTGLSREKAEWWEKKLIKKYKCNDRRYGYNRTPGGELRGPVSIETRQKESFRKYGSHWGRHTKEHKRRISKMYTGEGNPYYGHGRPVRCVETGKVFTNSYRAGLELCGEARSGIGRAAKGIRKTALGYHWEYV